MESVVEIVNEHLPPGSRPIGSLAHPGEINKSVVAILRTHVPMEMVGEMLQEMMQATRVTKHGELPDWRAREAAAKLILAYSEGLPIQRVETKNEQVANTDGDLLMRVLESPALMRNLDTLFAQVREAREKIKADGEEV